MDSQMHITILEVDSNHHPKVIRLTAQKISGGVDPVCTFDIRIGLSADSAETIGTSKACQMIDRILNRHDRLIWRSKHERDIFINMAKKHLDFPLFKNSVIVTPEVNNE